MGRTLRRPATKGNRLGRPGADHLAEARRGPREDFDAHAYVPGATPEPDLFVEHV
jgi:hypothetical protein